ncbi:MAG TPA: glycoside hydrolase family 19 protein [Allosphingosinicella sp.]|uniref:glycoside hydrolase family 19 protein n=1 Tax=Allosphingosinicella sp. TaxID=2823234 RepID=UPI002EDA2F56
MTPALVRQLQLFLNAAGHNTGGVDGVFGPATLAAYLCYVVGRQLGSIGILLARAMIAYFRVYDITTPLRIVHFVAQAAHETGGFRHFVELGSGDGPDADPWDDYLERYDFRADLGNSKPGDGEKTRGRGIFQLTGWANYIKMGKRIGVDLAAHPERAAEPELSVLIACIYWTDKKLNLAADNDNTPLVTKRINGGRNGLADREAKVKRGKKAWGLAA